MSTKRPLGIGVAILAMGVLGIAAGAVLLAGAEDPSELSPRRQAELAAWLDEAGQEPLAYVAGCFDDHDVVFLGEVHRVRHDVLLVQSLLETLHARGVRVLATEFGRRQDQADIDALLSAPEWDEALAREIAFRQFVWWGYREYVDVYKAAWRLNRRLPAGAPPFRVVGINNSPDWSHIRTRADLDDGRIKRLVWGGDTEEDWAEPILEAVAAGEQVLVHCGIHHAFTGYRQPIVVDGEFRHFDRGLRCGNHVREALGRRAMTIFLHGPWPGAGGYGDAMGHPAGGAIDALMAAAGPRPVGFDLDGGPFGDLGADDAVYHHGYEGFRLADFCDGWIYTRPLSAYDGVTPIPDWVHPGNLDHARLQSPSPKYRDAACEDFNAAIAREAAMAEGWARRLK